VSDDEKREKFRSALEKALREVGDAIITDFLDEREYFMEEIARLKWELDMQYQRNVFLTKVIEAEEERKRKLTTFPRHRVN
jgi:hypothetical protein